MCVYFPPQPMPRWVNRLARSGASLADAVKVRAVRSDCHSYEVFITRCRGEHCA
jgi:hypothetical protein